MPKQILLVDDSVTIHRVVEITFAHEDFAVTAVKSGDEGIDRARQLKPDVVLADAGQMPGGKTGYDVCKALRGEGSLGKTACLILTGNFTPYDEGKGTAAGADGFVVKPFETQALIDKVKDAITRRGGEVGASAPAAAAPAAAPAAATAAAKPGVESLGKPLSSVAAETAARLPAQPAAPAPRPAPMPVPTVPAAAAPPTAQAPTRPVPKATLMGIPAVNPAALGVAPPSAPPPRPTASIPVVTNVEPPKPAAPVAAKPPAPMPAMPATPSSPIPVMPARDSGPIKIETPRAAAPSAATTSSFAATLPANVPQMPRPPLIPGVPTPAPRASHAGGFAAEATMPGTSDDAPTMTRGPSGIDAAVRQAAERAAAAVPAAVAAKVGGSGPEYEAIAKLSREVIEQVVWEVVPELAETIIRAELDRLVRERQNA